MKTRKSQMLGVGLSFVVVLLSGFGLSVLGKPYSTLIFSVHKLVAMAAVISLGIAAVRSNRMAKLDPRVWFAVGSAGVLFLATIITGSLMSVGKAMPGIVHSLHQTTPYLTVLSTGIALFVLPRGAARRQAVRNQVVEGLNW